MGGLRGQAPIVLISRKFLLDFTVFEKVNPLIKGVSNGIVNVIYFYEIVLWREIMDVTFFVEFLILFK